MNVRLIEEDMNWNDDLFNPGTIEIFSASEGKNKLLSLAKFGDESGQMDCSMLIGLYSWLLYTLFLMIFLFLFSGRN